MDGIQETAPVSAEENTSTLSMISSLRNSESPVIDVIAEETKPTETPAATEPAQAEATEAPAEETDTEAEAKRTALLREIAIDPVRTSQYVQQAYAPQPPAQQPAQVDQAPVLPFDEFSFDPNNPAHQQALFDARLNEIGGPLFEKIDAIAQRFEQQDQQQQQQQMQQIAKQANEKTVDLLDTYVPGIRDIADKLTKSEKTTAQERAVWTEAVNAESYHMQSAALQIAQRENVPFNQAYAFVAHNVQLRAQISQEIGPYLKSYAKELGLVSQPKPTISPEVKAEMSRESYVESSNAVPASNANAFDKAVKKGDSLSMIAALRAK